MDRLAQHRRQINDQLARYGVKFGIYKNGTFQERLFPFDPLPRVIGAAEFARLEKGLVQRVTALNLFLQDVYGEKKIIRDGVVPEDFVFAGSGYLPPCEGIAPPKGIYSHISGIDLVQAKDGEWYILEDNLRIPSGASYPLIARGLCRRCSPETFRGGTVIDNRGYGALLRGVMDNVNTGGINVIFTPGRYNAAYFEHSYLAEQTGAVLAEVGELYVENNCVWYRSVHGPERVGAIYRRIGDDYLDPVTFRPDSLIGIPGVMDAYRAGNVALLNAPGNGVADDKGIYYVVMRTPQPIDTTTLNYNWQVWETNAFSVYTKETDCIDEESARQAVSAVLRFLSRVGVLKYSCHSGYLATVVQEGEMATALTPAGGIFRRFKSPGQDVEYGEILGEILDPFTCEVRGRITSPTSGVVFFAMKKPLATQHEVAFKVIRRLHT